MVTQGVLFDAIEIHEPRSRRSDPESSRVAADVILHSGAWKTNLDLVRAALRQFPGSTASELLKKMREAGLPLVCSRDEYHEVVRRLSDLKKSGHAMALECEMRRCAVLDKKVQVFRLTVDGEAYVDEITSIE